MKRKRQEILALVYASIETVNELTEDEHDKLELSEDTRLFGSESKLDSLGLVNLIIDIEQRFTDELGVEVLLTDDTVMSDFSSVFGNIGTLVDYISLLLEKDVHG